MALKEISNGDIRRVLNECKNSHSTRVNKLRDYVEKLGGKPAVDSGIWGPLAKFNQTGAGSEIDTVALLEEVEAERLVQYEAQQKIVVSPVLEALQTDLLPPQHETHLKVSSLLKSLQPVAQ